LVSVSKNELLSGIVICSVTNFSLLSMIDVFIR
jgi:hypothetical protein